MKRLDNDKGYTMIETLMYISLLIILGGVLAGYAHSIMLRYRTGRAAQQVIDLRKAIVHFTAADEDYSKLTIEGMDTGHSLPADMRTGSHDRAIHALGGELKLGPIEQEPLNDTSDNKNYMFFIQFNNVPQKSCTEILTQGQFYGDGSELDSLIVNSTAFKYQHSFYNVGQYSDGTNSITSIKTYSTSIRPNIAEAVKACSSKKNNNITWIFS